MTALTALASNATTVLVNTGNPGASAPAAPAQSFNFTGSQTFADTASGGTGSFDWQVTVSYFDQTGAAANYDFAGLLQSGELRSPNDGYFSFAVAITSVDNDIAGLNAGVSNLQLVSFNKNFAGAGRDQIQVIEGGGAGVAESSPAWGSNLAIGNGDFALNSGATSVLVRENPLGADDETGNNTPQDNNSTLRNFTFTGDFTAAAVPEPASAALLGLGGLALVARRRR